MGTKSATLANGIEPSNLANIPSANEKDALTGTSGTPSAANVYVTDDDPRMIDARTPATHATSHISTGLDAIPIAVPAGASGLLSGAWATLLNLATSAATALTLVVRDAAGRFKAADPSANDDVDTKGARDTAIAAAVVSNMYGTRVATLGASPVSFAASESKNVHTLTPTNGKVTTYYVVYRAVPAVNDGSGAGVFSEVFVMVRKTGGTVTVSNAIFGANQRLAPLASSTNTATASTGNLLIQFATSGGAATLDLCDVYARES